MPSRLLSLLCSAALLGAAERPPLVVVISVDQFSADLMSRWGAGAPGGLGRLAREGTWFQSAYQDHGYTETGPGHSVILSGCHPAHTGITENRWPDRATGKWTYCVSDPASPLIGDASRGASAVNFRATTLGQWLRDQVPGSRSFAVTGKDRSAILMAGAQADGVYWFEPDLGFTSSTAYTRALPAWLKELNQRLLTESETRSYLWEARSGLPEDGGTFSIRGLQTRFGLPRWILGLGQPRDTTFWNRFKASPFFDAWIFDAAEALIEQEGLGKGKHTDLLALGLSATDYVGHAYGTAGPEMKDQIARLDQRLGSFLEALRRRVPRAWVVLTADHGCADIPERLQSQGIPALRLDMAAWTQTLNDALARKLGTDQALFRPANGHQLHFDPAALKASGLERAAVLKAALELLRKDPLVAEACSAEELLALPEPGQNPAGRPLRERIRNSFVPDRSGELFLAFRPLVIVDDPQHACNHGTPHDIDRRVPLVFWGPWKAEPRTGPARLVDLAPTLARELELKPPAAVDGRPLPLQRRTP